MGDGTERLSQIWRQQELDLPQRIIINNFVNTINRFRVKLTAGSLMLRPATLTLNEMRPASLDERYLEAISAPFIKILEDLEAFVAEQKNQSISASAGGVPRLTTLKFACTAVKSNEIGVSFKSLLKVLPQSTTASDLGPDAAAILDGAYGLAKRIVGAFKELLELGRQELGEGDELDPFLVQLHWCSSSARLLGYAVHVMRRIEGVEGVLNAASLYDPDQCPLRSVHWGGKGAMH